MGQSTDAYLFYGYCWNDEVRLLDGDDKEWDQDVAHREGHSSPWDLYRDSGVEAEHELLPYEQKQVAYEAWKRSIDFESLYQQWVSAREEIKARYRGVDISSHCSCDYPMPYIYIEDSKSRAWRGEAQKIDPVAIASAPTGEWDESLHKFVTDLGIDMSDAEGPGWFLVSNWC